MFNELEILLIGIQLLSLVGHLNEDVAVRNSSYCLLVKAILCLEAVERLQWPKLYLLGRSRSPSRMPSLVGDSGQVLGLLGWALTRIHYLPLVLQCCRQDVSTVAVCGTEL